MSQCSFGSAEHALKKNRTRREKFLSDMGRMLRWARLIAVIESPYPTSGRVCRQPMGVPKMLRIYLLQQWYGLPMLVADKQYAHETVGTYDGVTFFDSNNAAALATLLKDLANGSAILGRATANLSDYPPALVGWEALVREVCAVGADT
jgi:hypothetical protein